MKYKKEIVLIVLNLIIFISTLILTIRGVISGAGEAQLGDSVRGLGYFKPFTMDSNILMAIISLIFVIYQFIKIFNKKDIPAWLNVTYFMGVIGVTLTLLMVVFYLAPQRVISSVSKSASGYFINFSYDLFFYHFLNPVLALVSFFIMDSKRFTYRENIIGCIPLIIYSIVYALSVVFNIWEDFYELSFGRKFYLIPLVLIILYLTTYLIGFILIKIKNKIIKNKV